MSWTLSASGHASDPGTEADLIAALRGALKNGGPYNATLTSQYHGTVNLLDGGDTGAENPEPTTTTAAATGGTEAVPPTGDADI